MKKTLIALLVFSLTAFNISANTIYETNKTEIVTRGLVHSYTERLTENGWQKINVLTADLTDENISVTTMYSEQGISYKATTSSLTEKSGAVAGINADFFDFSTASGRTTPLGLTVKDGRLISTSAHDGGLAAFVISDNTAFADYFKTEVFLCADNGNKAQILHINKYHPTASIVMFTPDWGAETPGTEDGSCEMEVVDGKVTDLRTNLPPFPIPSNGYVLRVDPAINNFFAENFEIGDNAEIEITITPDVGKIDTAAGGGTILVKEGKIAPFTNNVAGYNPRTAAGISKDGKTLYLVTAEGRETNTPGLTQTELAEIMISLGSYSAVNFDGGGSTTMSLRKNDGSISAVNTPSGGAERPVSTALGVKSTGEDAYFAHLSVSASKENVFLGDSIEIWSLPLDNYYNPTILEYSLQYSADDGGEFSENRYYPAKAGLRTVKVTAGGVTGEIKINVLDSVSNLSFYPAVFSGKNAYLAVVAADGSGFKSQISPENVIWWVESGNASVSKGSVTADGAVCISASFGGKTAYTYGNSESAPLLPMLADSARGPVETSEFTVFPFKLNANTFLNSVLNNFIEKKAASENGTFSFGEYKTKTAAIDSHFIKGFGNTEVICLKNKSSVISNGADQWKELIALKESPCGNIVVLLTDGIAFSDKSEEQMFKALVLDFYKAGKSVFVVSYGDTNCVEIENGARYITVKKYPAVELSDFENSKKDAKYLRFGVKDGRLTYEFADIYD